MSAELAGIQQIKNIVSQYSGAAVPMIGEVVSLNATDAMVSVSGATFLKGGLIVDASTIDTTNVPSSMLKELEFDFQRWGGADNIGILSSTSSWYLNPVTNDMIYKDSTIQAPFYYGVNANTGDALTYGITPAAMTFRKVAISPNGKYIFKDNASGTATTAWYSLISKDYGETWENIAHPASTALSNTDINATVITDDGIILSFCAYNATSGARILVSTDFGITYSTVYSSTVGFTAAAITRDINGVVTLVVWSHTGSSTYTLGYVTFNKLTRSVGYTSLAFSSQAAPPIGVGTGGKVITVNSSTTNNLLVSSNYGVTWSASTLVTNSAVALDDVQANGIGGFVITDTATSNGVVSIDNGVTWTNVAMTGVAKAFITRNNDIIYANDVESSFIYTNGKGFYVLKQSTGYIGKRALNFAYDMGASAVTEPIDGYLSRLVSGNVSIVYDIENDLYKYVINNPASTRTGSKYIPFNTDSHVSFSNTGNGIYSDLDGLLIGGAGAPTNKSDFKYDLSWFDDTTETKTFTEETTIRTLQFNLDGSKAFILGTGTKTIYRYTLSTPYDISTATYDTVSFSVAADITTPAYLKFDTSGSKFYILDQANDTITQYDLTVAWDITTAVKTTKTLVTSTKEEIPSCLDFKPDGTILFVSGTNSDKIHAYTLSVPWDISTATFSASSPGSTGENNITGMGFHSDGTVVYVAGSGSDNVRTCLLSTPWDISTMSTTWSTTSAPLTHLTMTGFTYNENTFVFYSIQNAVVSKIDLVSDLTLFPTAPYAIHRNGENVYIGMNNTRIYHYNITTKVLKPLAYDMFNTGIATTDVWVYAYGVGNILAIEGDTTAPIAARSTDGGVTWTNVAQLGSTDDVASNGFIVDTTTGLVAFITTLGALYISVDNGATFTTRYFRSAVEGITYDPINKKIIMVLYSMDVVTMSGTNYTDVTELFNMVDKGMTVNQPVFDYSDTIIYYQGKVIVMLGGSYPHIIELTDALDTTSVNTSDYVRIA